ncbi:thermonuclease family protein [Sphingomonas jaspsi]|uniref:thermonuclease family protein n=1 Tax=Sphingomonas jaspsi TaxID=392409 RepID=UPI000A0073B4|nr:thermonuclease family protein [Sphingomonas jaspsi]
MWKIFSGIATCLLSQLVALTSATAAPIYGIARAMDGDSLHVGDTEIRLFGIDAPEWDQTCKKGGAEWACGQEAAKQLSDLVTGRDVRCDPMGRDQHQRTLAQCSVGTVDVNRTMVQRGYAIAFRRYSTDYVSAEETAKASKRGIWAGNFENPQQYRGETRPVERVVRNRPTAPVRSKPQASGWTGGCSIKGNHSRRGELIYHLPGMPYYNETRAEQMFCTEAEARAAGYRRSRAQ